MKTEPISNHVSTQPEWPNVLSGIWLIMSPFVLAFSRDPSATWNNLCTGGAVLVLAFATGLWRGALPGLNVLLAAWLFFSPFVLGFSGPGFLWNNVGMAFIIIAGTGTSEAFRAMHYAPGDAFSTAY